MTNREPCRHCGRLRWVQQQSYTDTGLCGKCFNTREVRELYGLRKHKPAEPEPTEDELERMIAEQMACLPEWWVQETEAIVAGEWEE